MMSKEDFEENRKRLESDELYKKSKSVHKAYQYMRFTDSDGKPLEGQIVRREDRNMIPMGGEGYDEASSRLVIYSFRDGVLHSNEGEPAVQYPGHWEIWDAGLLMKVVSDGGDTQEFWENGVPICIETNLAEKRQKAGL
ncbi:MAG: hypothetical protein KBT11_12040 [Treponema sp.]|nr:hypothetical protein [Candidatus Treponema equifaecale]